MRREYGRGGTEIGVARARDLSNGRPVSAETIGRMVSFFARHEGSKDSGPEDGRNGKIAWLLWGGDPGRSWANEIYSRMKKMDLELTGAVLKADDDRQIAYGWASVIKKGDDYIVDRQGDAIREDALINAVHRFMSDARTAKMMHRGSSVGEIVESLVVTDVIRKALNIDDDTTGWFIGMKIKDESVWKAIKSGELRAFSIGGSGSRSKIEEE